MRIVWAKETKDDFRRFDDFLGSINPDAAQRAVQAIREGTIRLIEQPEIGKSLDDGTDRRELFIQFGQRGYVLRYIIDREARRIVILRVWHSLEDRR
ncbi:MAG: type II toxin-antitoxin system RelE/ParE family toxin [Pseudomonadota bacterium]